MAVEAFYEAETVWMSDIDKAASKVIAERWQLANLGDLKRVEWTSVEPIDILTAGYPCQPFSNAGKRKGANDTRHLWPEIRKVISILRPRIVILENVAGHLTLGFKEVLEDLTQIGYDARWQVVRASEAGAPHQRSRLFVIAYPNGEAYDQSRRASKSIYGSTNEVINGSNWDEYRNCPSTIANSHNSGGIRSMSESRRRFDTPFQMSMLNPPNPLVESKLNTKFVEYMMGLPTGWVTDLDLSRNQQFRLLGNGVVPQQAYLALQILNKVVQIVRQ